MLVCEKKAKIAMNKNKEKRITILPQENSISINLKSESR